MCTLVSVSIMEKHLYPIFYSPAKMSNSLPDKSTGSNIEQFTAWLDLQL